MKSALATRKRSFTQTNWLCRFALACAFSLAMGASCFASTITLQWDPESAPDLAGYKVYYSTSPAGAFTGTGATQGPSPVNVSTENRTTITGLDPGTAYYFAVTAYNSDGVESPYSNIVEVPELIPPTVSITSPSSNASVTGTVSVTTSASDNLAITRLETYVNGVLQGTETTTPYLFSWDTSALASGVYTLSAKAYDAAGNVGESAPVPVTVANDAAEPTVALNAPGNGATLRGQVPVTAVASDDIGVTKVEFYANGSLLFAGNVSPYSYVWDTTQLANGSYSLTAKAYDAVGKVGQSATLLVQVLNDALAPAVSIAAPAAGGTVSGTVAVSADATDNIEVARVEFFLNGVLQATSTSAPYGFTWNTVPLANGDYSLSAKAYDAAGNVGQSATLAVSVFNDTTAPTVSITSPLADSTAAGSMAFSASASDNVGVSRVDFFVNGVLKGTSTSAPYLYTWNTATAANGAYILRAKAYDAAGNIGLSANVTVTVFNDTTAPTVSITSPLADSTAAGSMAFSASASDNVGVSRVDFFVNGVLKGTSTSAPYLYTWNTTTAANGAYILRAKAYDAAGNVGLSANVTVTVFNDTTAPTVSITSPLADSTAAGSMAFSASASDNVGVSRVDFFVNGVLKGSSTSAPYVYTWNTTTAANGAYILRAKAYDAAGNVGLSANVTVTVFNDTTAPTVSITSPLADSTAAQLIAFSASASDNVGVSRVDFFVNGVLKGSSTSAPYVYTWNTTTAANGAYILRAKAYDAAGNVGLSANVTVTVFNDTTAPTVSITSPLANSAADGTVAVSATAGDNVAVSKVEFYLNGVLQATSSAAPYSFNWNTAALANGSYTLSAKAYDAAGNVGQSAGVSVAVAHPVADTTPPSILFIAPTTKYVMGSSVRIAASATDNVSVSRMELYIDGVLKSSVSASSLNSYWPLAVGQHVITIKAYDQSNVGISSITVSRVF